MRNIIKKKKCLLFKHEKNNQTSNVGYKPELVTTTTRTDTETGRLIVTRGYPSKGVVQNKCQNLIT